MRNHPLFNYFTFRENNYFCKKCNKSYPKESKLDTLRQHFSHKHREIWLTIRNSKTVPYSKNSRDKPCLNSANIQATSSMMNFDQTHHTSTCLNSANI